MWLIIIHVYVIMSLYWKSDCNNSGKISKVKVFLCKILTENFSIFIVFLTFVHVMFGSRPGFLPKQSLEHTLVHHHSDDSDDVPWCTVGIIRHFWYFNIPPNTHDLYPGLPTLVLLRPQSIIVLHSTFFKVFVAFIRRLYPARGSTLSYSPSTD